MGGSGEGQRSGGDAGDAAIGIGPGERHGAGGGLVQPHAAREYGAGRAAANVVVGGGSQDPGGAGDGSALQGDGGHGVAEGGDVKGASINRHVAGVCEGAGDAEGERTSGDGGAAGISVDRGERKDARTALGKTT